MELVGSNLDQVFVEIIPPSFDANAIFKDRQQAEQRVTEVDLTTVESKSDQPKYQLQYDGFDQVGEYQLIFQASNVDEFTQPMQTTVTVTEGRAKPANKLTGDVNGGGTVNIFDLVIVAGNFGQSLATLAIASEIELTTEQKHHIASAIDQLEARPQRSSAEEMALNVLKTILPERLPSQTKLLANYPNPFNPET
ncbi:TPA: hypothetical protein EYN65_15600 [Candidatus Poribacteria bacterium]|nr:hypothetical protein [Candidatus Poribacteria bacterium]HIC02625.1 hypothetical protein [Candidatus Poribacteria bacterium]